MDQPDTTSNGRSRALIIGGFAIVVVLLIIGLFLPPISLGDRLGFGGSQEPAAAGEPAAEDRSVAASEFTADNASLPQGVALALSSGAAELSAQSQSDFLAANPAAAPAERLSLVGDIFSISADSGTAGQVALPIPADVSSLETLDLLGWDGSQWQFTPSQVDAASKQIVSADEPLPQAFAVAQSAAPAEKGVSAIIDSGETPPAPFLPYITDMVVSGLKLTSEGTLAGEVERQPDGAYDQWLNVNNVGPIVDQTAVSTLLSDSALQQAQIDELVTRAAEGDFAGIDLNYQQIPDSQRDAFTAFVANLAAALHDQGKRLAVTVSSPSYTGSSWNTGGQDWAALGRAADIVNVELPFDPTAYDEGDEASQVLEYATRQIDRNELRAVVNAAAVARFGDTFTTLVGEEALANFGELQFVQGSEEVQPNETVEVALSGTASPLEWDGDSLTYKYSYEQDGDTHEVWLGSEAALNHRLLQTVPYHISGISLSGLESISDGAAYAAALASVLGEGEAPQPTGAAIVWTVRDGNDSVLASESGSDLSFSWDVGESEGEYVVNADFALGESITPLAQLTVDVKASEEVVEEEPAEEEVAAEESETTTTAAGTTGDAVVNVGANIRTGPGLTYGTIADGADPGTTLKLIGRNSDSSWLNVILPDGQEGWVFASLVTVNSGTDVNSLAVVEVAPPSAPAASTTTESADSETSEGEEQTQTAVAAAPPPVAAAPVSNPGFELGGQSHSFGNPQLMDYAGMNWIKFQHKWGPEDTADAVAGRIQQAHANGFKVLLSIPGQTTYPDSIDFASYVEFLRGVAALGPDAIEVWNEENIDFEWPAGSIDPASYVNNMLAPAYNAIKSTNPNVMVISGAPAPTGYFGGGCSPQGCDDNAYLAGMAAAGAAGYMDCVGVHFNAGATAPSQSSGHPAGSNHYSWYFQPTLDLYYSSLGKPVCFTELGYLSGEDFGGVPSRFSWAGNTTVAQHSQWLAEAVSLAANSGKARLAIIFNVDFTQYGDDPQAGYAMIRPDGSCPACETLRQVMGG
ncbi:MAG: SH3 domain-containing protein [Candidatus Promineifilaceae bacterium]